MDPGPISRRGRVQRLVREDSLGQPCRRRSRRGSRRRSGMRWSVHASTSLGFNVSRKEICLAYGSAFCGVLFLDFLCYTWFTHQRNRPAQWFFLSLFQDPSFCPSPLPLQPYSRGYHACTRRSCATGRNADPSAHEGYLVPLRLGPPQRGRKPPIEAPLRSRM
jgi:hypothetical protein